MARDFDGTNDKIDLGSDASLDDLNPITVMAWVRPDAASQDDIIAAKQSGANSGWGFQCGNTRIRLQRGHSTTDGDWNSGAGSLPTGELHHVAVTYDNGNVANDPTFYKDAAAQTTTEVAAPVGTPGAEAALALVLGESSGGVQDLDGLLGHVVVAAAILTAADVNRARFWGCAPGGPSTVKVWQPLWTDLANRGTAVAPGTATGTTPDNANCPRVERMWGSMLGCGR